MEPNCWLEYQFLYIKYLNMQVRTKWTSLNVYSLYLQRKLIDEFLNIRPKDRIDVCICAFPFQTKKIKLIIPSKWYYCTLWFSGKSYRTAHHRCMPPVCQSTLFFKSIRAKLVGKFDRMRNSFFLLCEYILIVIIHIWFIYHHLSVSVFFYYIFTSNSFQVD